jgi:hypothetical protein
LGYNSARVHKTNPPPPLAYATPQRAVRPSMARILWSLFSGTFLIALGMLFGFATIATARSSIGQFGRTALLAMGVMFIVAAILIFGGALALRAAIVGLRGTPPRNR